MSIARYAIDRLVAIDHVALTPHLTLHLTPISPAISLSISLYAVRPTAPATQVGSLVGIDQIVRQHWQTYGRNYYARYDYEAVDAGKAAMMLGGYAASATCSADRAIAPRSLSRSRRASTSLRWMSLSTTTPSTAPSRRGRGYAPETVPANGHPGVYPHPALTRTPPPLLPEPHPRSYPNPTPALTRTPPPLLPVSHRRPHPRCAFCLRTAPVSSSASPALDRSEPRCT